MPDHCLLQLQVGEPKIICHKHHCPEKLKKPCRAQSPVPTVGRMTLCLPIWDQLVLCSAVFLKPVHGVAQCRVPFQDCDSIVCVKHICLPTHLPLDTGCFLIQHLFPFLHYDLSHLSIKHRHYFARRGNGTIYKNMPMLLFPGVAFVSYCQGRVYSLGGMTSFCLGSAGI